MTSFNLGVAFNHAVVSLSFMINMEYAKCDKTYVGPSGSQNPYRPIIKICSSGVNGANATQLESIYFDSEKASARSMKLLNRRIQRFLNRQEIKEAIERKNDIRKAA